MFIHAKEIGATIEQVILAHSQQGQKLPLCINKTL
jgi:hypothetical protein